MGRCKGVDKSGRSGQANNLGCLVNPKRMCIVDTKGIPEVNLSFRA